MRLSEYDKVNALEKTDAFVLDTSAGTKSILAIDMAKALAGMEDEKADISFYEQLDDQIPMELRRNLWRGKNLGSVVTEKQWNEIGNGTFRGLFLGDYWEINGYKWRIMDFDYWLHKGDTPCETNHLVIMPDVGLYTSAMNDTDTTEGGYVGSKMYKSGLNQAKEMVNSAFGTAHVLNHRELLINTVKDGHASAGSWYDSTVELPNEIMMYGCYIFTPAGNGTIIPYLYLVDKDQLAGTKAYPKMIDFHEDGAWFRDVVSANSFSSIGSAGFADTHYAHNGLGVCPVFGICKSNS